MDRPDPHTAAAASLKATLARCAKAAAAELEREGLKAAEEVRERAKLAGLA